ncbi:MAG: glycosyltransferase family 39 protein, partial [Candidatus Omnitrophica bacterium]|nr:glycosyltransferase family 39 protein [Candidatus Omnitrophota bacterium]
MKIKNAKCFILSLLFFTYLFIVYDVNFNGPDYPIYLAYTASLVDDGDLNAAKHSDSSYYYSLFLNNQIAVSKTYNLPDYHNHGGVVLWAPFYAYAKLIGIIADKLSIKKLTLERLNRLTRCMMSFSTVVFAFFTVLLTYALCRIFFSVNIALWSIIAVFFGTPFIYYTIQETANATIIACLLSILSIWFCIYALGMKKSHWFLYGIFFSNCSVAKSALWFQIFFIFPFFVYLLKNKQTNLINGLYFIIGTVPGLAL